MLTEASERADVLYYMGQTLHALGRFPEASKAFRRGAALVEDDAHAWLRFHGAGASAEFFITTPTQRMQADIRPDDLADGSGTRVMLALQSLQKRCPSSVGLAVQALLHAGELSAAHDAADAAVRDVGERGALLAHVEASYVRACVCYARGRITEAVADAQAALDGLEWRWHDHRQRAVAIFLHCLVERGELPQAASLIERADQEFLFRWPRVSTRCCIWRVVECIFVCVTAAPPTERSKRRQEPLQTTGRSIRPRFRGGL